MRNVRNIAWIAVLIAAVFVGLQFLTSTDNRAIRNTVIADGPGGPFNLISHTGETLTDQDFRGRYMLIYFGYSFCPDVCPLELQKLTSSLLALESEGYDISPLQPLFISVDPTRDTPEALADYVPLFHESLIGLTGSEQDIAKLADEYNVYYSKQESEDLEGYLMNHLSVIFLMNKDGSYNRIFTSRDQPETIAEALKPLLSKAG